MWLGVIDLLREVVARNEESVQTTHLFQYRVGLT